MNGEILRKSHSIALISIVVSALPISISTAANKPTPQLPKKSVNFGNGCYGATHDPHPSTHVPGTINVTSETSCKGKHVSVITDLYLGDPSVGMKILTQSHDFKFEHATTETNFVCAPGKIYRVTAISYHSGEWRQNALTGNSATVLCMKTIRSLVAITPKK